MGWCSETLEHIPQEYQKKFVDEVVEFVKIFYGLFQFFDKKENRHFTFNDDIGHNEVIVDMKSYEKDFQVFDLSTKTQKGIWLFVEKTER